MLNKQRVYWKYFPLCVCVKMSTEVGNHTLTIACITHPYKLLAGYIMLAGSAQLVSAL